MHHKRPKQRGPRAAYELLIDRLAGREQPVQQLEPSLDCVFFVNSGDSSGVSV